jgi:nucleotide-binding universal stress UspA family protein
MAPRAIISYDDTQTDHDALMLGRILGDAGATLMLAYVRHAIDAQPDREQLAHHEAEALLERGALWLDEPHIDRRLVVSPSTAEGLGWLATQVEADLIVFGSDYRTRNGYVAIGHSAQTLLENGPTSLALAPANYATNRDREVQTIGVLAGSADEAAIETAFSLAGRLGAKVTDGNRGVDLLVVGSRPEAHEGRVMITSRAEIAIEETNSPVIVVARGVPLNFETLVTI